jgi:hypothetical protein
VASSAPATTPIRGRNMMGLLDRGDWTVDRSLGAPALVGNHLSDGP